MLCEFEKIDNKSYKCKNCDFTVNNINKLPIYAKCKNSTEENDSINIILEPIQKQIDKTNCIHKSKEHIRTEQCQSCQGNVQIKIFECKIYKECTLSKPLPNISCCETCPDYSEYKEQ